MGIVGFNWAEEGNNQLVLLMNRDNWGNRVINEASWNGQILSGRSADNNGTWLAISRGGRVAFLMSKALLLDHVVPDSGCELYPHEFLEGNMSPQDFAVQVAQRDVDKQTGLSYSLILADMNSNSMVHMRKPDQDEHQAHNMMIEHVPFGLHTVSPDGGLDSANSVRALRMRDHFNHIIGVLGNDQLPDVKEIARRAITPGVFFANTIEHPNPELGMQRFGTTSTTALAVTRTRDVMFYERYRDINGEWTWIKHDFDLNI
ncbi:hypothetical protein CARUB_v10025514mg [Capsella rubella]|uniref:NRDE family protein n=1 Tax=Capsella rubella TaxID=81985 RepID=R0HUZ8_9BRAS|nr:uncharacterized protein LOC17887675 [Capsella rubella]EOA29240.1 hypothetical protein CARUB_v10025514mg [Capsella rubella]